MSCQWCDAKIPFVETYFVRGHVSSLIQPGGFVECEDEPMGDTRHFICPKTEHVDGRSHRWTHEGDEPIATCDWCGRMEDTLTGKVIEP